jgi:signal peptidase I
MPNESERSLREQVRRLGRPGLELLNLEILRQQRKESYQRLARGVLLSLLAAVALIVLATNLWLPVLQMEGQGMQPLLQAAEIVCAVKTANVSRSDIVVFPVNNRLYVKRIVAVAGDWVDFAENGAFLLNGEPLAEPYAAGTGVCTVPLPLQVPSGMVFVLSDNRQVANDSRNGSIGPIAREQIMGKVLFRLWPLPRAGVLK